MQQVLEKHTASIRERQAMKDRRKPKVLSRLMFKGKLRTVAKVNASRTSFVRLLTLQNKQATAQEKQLISSMSRIKTQEF